MAEFVLVHGAGLGGWIWAGVIPVLAALGHRAVAVDLPGRGGGAVTLGDQARAVLAAAPQGALLVGHSAGGFAVTAAAQMAPERVAGLIHVAAFVPRPGQSIADLRRAAPIQTLRHAYRLAPDRLSFDFDPVMAAGMFFHDCPGPAALAARLCAEPAGPQTESLPALTHGRPQGAVICLEDRAILPGWQAEMADGIGPRICLPCGHMPMLAAPEATAAALSGLAAMLRRGVRS